jgi:hypothetical protein
MPHAEANKPAQTVFKIVLAATLLLFISALSTNLVQAGDPEYVGTLDGQLVPNTDGLDQIIFRPLRDLSKVKFATPLESGAIITAGRLYDPIRDKSAILALLVEPEDEGPFLYADIDLDGTMADSEKFSLEHDEDGNPYIFHTTIELPFKNALSDFRSILQRRAVGGNEGRRNPVATVERSFCQGKGRSQRQSYYG